MELSEENRFNYKPVARTIDEMLLLRERGRLNLSPGFQRNSVWKEKAREKLIDSIVQGYPLPAIFWYQRKDEKTGDCIFDVIDGKQRLESIILFCKNKFPVKIGGKKIFYRNFVSQKKQHVIKNYELNIILVEGNFDEIIDLFVRINSTGTPLSAPECNNAKYYQSEFLKAAYRLSKFFKELFLKNEVFSGNDITRMKDIGFLCDFMYAVYTKNVCDKKSARNNAFGDLTDNRSISKVEKESKAAIKKVFQMFPDLRTTRFKQISDFYCLCVLIHQYQAIKKLALDDKKKNLIAFEFLTKLSVGVASLKEKKQKYEPNNNIYNEYSATVQHSTDSLSQRSKRLNILDSFLCGIFEKKAERRIFSPAQRMILWHTSEDKCCVSCGRKLTWENFTIDHIKPYSKGGKTCVQNGALMCQSCNSKKGNNYKR